MFEELSFGEIIKDSGPKLKDQHLLDLRLCIKSLISLAVVGSVMIVQAGYHGLNWICDN